MFLKCFYDMIKISHNSVNITLTLAPRHECFYAKCVQFPLTFTEWNLKSHLNSVLLCK